MVKIIKDKIVTEKFIKRELGKVKVGLTGKIDKVDIAVIGLQIDFKSAENQLGKFEGKMEKRFDKVMGHLAVFTAS